MKTERTHKKSGLRRLIACLVVALMLLGVAPVWADDSLLPNLGPINGTVTVKIGADGFGSTGAVLGFLNIVFGIDSANKAADLSVSLLGKGLDIIFAWGEDGFRFTVPAMGNDVYGLGAAFLKELTGSMGNKLPAGKANVKLPDLKGFFTDFIGLAVSYVTPETLTSAEGPYNYILLNGDDQGTAFTWVLTKEQWKEYLSGILQLVSGNDELIDFIAQNAGKTAEELRESLKISDEELDKTAGQLADCRLALFMANGSLRSLYFGNDSDGILYEAQGALMGEGRTAAIGLRKSVNFELLLTNRISMTDKGIAGKMDIAGKDISLSYSLETENNNGIKLVLAVSAEGKTVSLTFLYTPGTAFIEVPGKPTKMINSTQDFSEVIEGLASVVYSLIGA